MTFFREKVNFKRKRELALFITPFDIYQVCSTNAGTKSKSSEPSTQNQ